MNAPESLAAQPPEEAPVWRYLDLAKFCSLLHESALWFARADTLEDTHEGARGSATQLAAPIEFAPAQVHIASIYERLAEWTYVNCWHRAERESMGMWRGYVASGQGVAIQSTFGRLIRSSKVAERATWGLVSYVDPDVDVYLGGSLLEPYFRKRWAFSYESEVRGVIQEVPKVAREWVSWGPGEDGIRQQVTNSALGKSIAVDPAVLIERVVLAPGTPDWLSSAVTGTMAAFGLDPALLKRSDLDARPVY